MTILCTGPGTYTGDDLKIGSYYQAESAAEGSSAQNRVFHALLAEYWRSGCHSYNAKSFEHFRELIKLYLGAGAEKYYSLVDVYGNLLEKPTVCYRTKSWGRYTKKERKESIDRLIAEMETVGVNTPKYREILRGLEEGK